MTIEKLQALKIAALKNGDVNTKRVLSDMIDSCQKATITPKGRVELTEQLIDETLIKYQKTVQEMIDTWAIAAIGDLILGKPLKQLPQIRNLSTSRVITKICLSMQ